MHSLISVLTCVALLGRLGAGVGLASRAPAPECAAFTGNYKADGGKTDFWYAPGTGNVVADNDGKRLSLYKTTCNNETGGSMGIENKGGSNIAVNVRGSAQTLGPAFVPVGTTCEYYFPANMDEKALCVSALVVGSMSEVVQ